MVGYPRREIARVWSKYLTIRSFPSDMPLALFYSAHS